MTMKQHKSVKQLETTLDDLETQLMRLRIESGK